MSSQLLSPSRPDRDPTAAHDQLTTGSRRNGSALLLLVILTAQLMVVLDTTIVNVALPHIQRGLDFSSTGLSWVLNAYILTFGGFLLLGARAGDLLGRRRIFLIGIAVFTLSSLAGGLAATSWMLLLARAIQGLGAALAAPSALSLLTTVFPEGPKRVRAIGLYTTVSAAGGAIGLVAGGVLTDLVSWRWVMFVNVPIGIVIWLIGRVVLAETERREGRFDLAGALTSTLGMSAVVLGLVEAGTDGWTGPVTLLSFVVGLSLLGWFVRQESRVDEPVLPLRLLTKVTRTSANTSRALLYAGMYGMFFFICQFLQDVQGFSPLLAGVAFLPLPASVFLSSQLTSRVLVGRLPQRVVIVLGAAFATASLLLATALRANTSYGQIAASMVLLGIGSGMAFVSLTTASLADVDEHDAGAASGLINVSQQLGAAVGLAVLVAVFDGITHHSQLSANGSAASLVRGLDDVFFVGVLFTLAALAMAAFGIRAKSEPVVQLHRAAAERADLGQTEDAGGDFAGDLVAGHGEPRWVVPESEAG